MHDACDNSILNYATKNRHLKNAVELFGVFEEAEPLQYLYNDILVAMWMKFEERNIYLKDKRLKDILLTPKLWRCIQIMPNITVEL